jgi:hypothetical protein
MGIGWNPSELIYWQVEFIPDGASIFTLNFLVSSRLKSGRFKLYRINSPGCIEYQADKFAVG